MIACSGSKKGIFCLAVFILGYYFLTHEKNRFFIFLGIVASIPIAYMALIKIPPLYHVMGYRIEEYVNALMGISAYNASDRTRNYLIQLGLNWFKDKPLFGYGMATFKSMYSSTTGSTHLLYAHNNYIELLVGGGIVGLAIYYVGYIYLFFKSIHLTDKRMRQFVLLTLFTAIIMDYGLVSYLVLSFQIILAVCFSMIEINCD